MSSLRDASRQLFDRPIDESYASMDDVVRILGARMNQSEVIKFRSKDVRFEVSDRDNIHLIADDRRHRLNHLSFEQICQIGRIPSDFALTLSPKVATDVLNERRRYYASGINCALMLKGGEDQPGIIRGIFSTQYSQIFDFSIAAITHRLSRPYGFIPGGHLAGRTGHGISAEMARQYGIRQSSGLYVGERDIFLFLMSPERIQIAGEELYLGFFVEHSEVRDGALSFTSYICDGVCANHLIWGAQDIQKTRWIHKGDSRVVLSEFRDSLDRFLSQYLTDGKVKEDLESLVLSAKSTPFAPDNISAIDRLRSEFKLPKNLALSSYEYATDRYGQIDGRSVWGIHSGVIFTSQSKHNQDGRVQLDRIASRILQTAL